MIGDGGHAQTILFECGAEPKGGANIVAIGDNRTRKRVVEEIEGKEPGKQWDVAMAGIGWLRDRNPALDARGFGPGSMILDKSYIAGSAKIGRHCIINHYACVEHGVTLGAYVHVAPGAKVLGDAIVGEGAFIGANAVVLPGVTVPPWAIIRACSVYPADYLAWEDEPGVLEVGDPLGRYGYLEIRFQKEKK